MATQRVHVSSWCLISICVTATGVYHPLRAIPAPYGTEPPRKLPPWVGLRVVGKNAESIHQRHQGARTPVCFRPWHQILFLSCLCPNVGSAKYQLKFERRSSSQRTIFSLRAFRTYNSFRRFWTNSAHVMLLWSVGIAPSQAVHPKFEGFQHFFCNRGQRNHAANPFSMLRSRRTATARSD